LTELEVLCGPVLLQHQDLLFKERWMQEANYYRELLQHIPHHHSSYQRFARRLQLIEEVL